MGRASYNRLFAKDFEAENITNLNSTTTTSITVLTGQTSTLSSEVLFTTQTIYLSKGIIVDFSTVTSTSLILD